MIEESASKLYTMMMAMVNTKLEVVKIAEDKLLRKRLSRPRRRWLSVKKHSAL